MGGGGHHSIVHLQSEVRVMDLAQPIWVVWARSCQWPSPEGWFQVSFAWARKKGLRTNLRQRLLNLSRWVVKVRSRGLAGEIPSASPTKVKTKTSCSHNTICFFLCFHENDLSLGWILLDWSSFTILKEEEPIFSMKRLPANPVSLKQIKDTKQRRDALLPYFCS